MQKPILNLFPRITLGTLLVLSGLMTLLASPAPARAAINEQINLQSRVTDPDGNIVGDGTYNMEFKLMTVASGGDTTQGSCTTSCVWMETRTGGNKVTISRGLMAIQLGSVTSLAGVDFNQNLYLSIRLGGTGTPGWDPEMSPRDQLGAAPTSLFANDSGMLNGQPASFYLDPNNLSTAVPATKGGTGQTSYTKGDILAATGASALTKLGVGSDTQVLTADSSTATGLKWSNAATGTVTSVTCPSGTGNLTGSGNTITTSGTCTSLNTVSNPTFSGATTLSNTGANALAVTGAPTNSATQSLIQTGNAIASGNTATNGGTYIGLNAPNTGAGSTADLVNLQKNGSSLFKVDTSGNLTLSGSISGGTTITGTTVNGTTGINTGASAGTQRIDSSGNLLNIGTYTTSNGTMTSSVANGASAIGFTLNTSNAFSTAGAKLVSVNNNSVEKFAIDKDGLITTTSVQTASIQDNAVTTSKIGTIPSVGAYNNAAITLANNTTTALTMNSERWDNDSMHSTSSNTSRLTATTAGVYSINCVLQFNNNAAGVRWIFIRQNGTNDIAFNRVPVASNNVDFGMTASVIYKLNANDYVECYAGENSGSSLDVDATSYSPAFSMTWNSKG